MMDAALPTDLRRDAMRDVAVRRGLAFCAMLAVAMAFRAEHLTDWDSWDYAAQASRGHSSDLLLGRWWFVALMRGAYLIGRELFGLNDLNGWLAMQAACSLLMAGAVVAGMAWTRRLTGSVAAEMLFAALLVLGPMIGIYAPAVMTEGATLLLIGLSFWLWERAIASHRRGATWALAAGLAFGVMVTMREQAVVLAAWPIVSCVTDRPARRRVLLAAGLTGALVTLGIGVLGAMAWFPWSNMTYFQNVGRWIAAMRTERRLFAVRLGENLYWTVGFLFAAAPVLTLLLAPSLLWVILRRHRRLLALTVAVVPYFVTLLINHDLAVNPRFIIPGAFVLAPIVAAAIDAALVAARPAYRRRLGLAVCGVLAAGLAAMLLGWSGVRTYYLDDSHWKHEAFGVMVGLPAHAVIVAGPGTPVACHLNRLGLKNFDVVGSGWSWPGEKLAERIAEAVRGGKEVYVNLDAETWNLTTRYSGELRQLETVAAKYALDRRAWPLVRLVKPAGNVGAESQPTTEVR